MTTTLDVTNDIARIAALTNVGGDNNFKIGHLVDEQGQDFVAYQKNTQDLYKVAVRLPDGSTEYWQQTNGAHNTATGFKAMAFERCNEDGSTYLNEQRQPQTMITFPGNTGTDKDMEAAKGIIEGADMNERYHNVETFVDDVVNDMQERAARHSHDMGEITIGAHSIGATALGTGAYVRNEYGIENTRTYLINPVGAGQALEQLTIRNAARYYGEQPTAEQIKQAANDLSSDVISIRPDDDTVFSTLKIGDEQYDNAMVGKTYRFKSDDTATEDFINISDHQLKSAALAGFAHGDHGFTATPAQDMTGAQILEGGGVLSDMEQLWTKIKTFLFETALPLLKTLFNEEACGKIRESPATPRNGFAEMAQDIQPFPHQKDTNAPQTPESTAQQATAPSFG